MRDTAPAGSHSPAVTIRCPCSMASHLQTSVAYTLPTDTAEGLTTEPMPRGRATYGAAVELP